ncbi:hypothetical protein BVI2075_1260018 [Burkholderia vietnamiensis]|nr:hypothetical protein BVI2075_1260018 [Burkholderia vietnamiensis]
MSCCRSCRLAARGDMAIGEQSVYLGEAVAARGRGQAMRWVAGQQTMGIRQRRGGGAWRERCERRGRGLRRGTAAAAVSAEGCGVRVYRPRRAQ